MFAFIGGYNSQQKLSKLFWANFNLVGFLDKQLIQDTIDFAVECNVIEESETKLAKSFLSSLVAVK